jgi:membrane-associated phospholipid phosphatase
MFEKEIWRKSMDSTTDRKRSLEGTIVNGDSKQQDARATRIRWIVAITFWIIGFMALIVASVIVHSHPSPWPFEVQTTITMQQLQLPFWVSSPIVWASIVDNPIPSAIGFVLWFVILSLIGVVVWRRGGSPIPWFVTAIFISIGVPVMAGLNAIIGHLVARPRPTSPPIHVFMPENGIPSFPSGHVENDVVYFGFLLYLSFTKPVSQWRYRWVLIPFQLYAALNILFIGYSRVLEGSHWLNDALAGYLTGALLLALLVVLYRWTLDKLNKWYAKRLLEKSAQNQQA